MKIIDNCLMLIESLSSEDNGIEVRHSSAYDLLDVTIHRLSMIIII